MMMVVSTTETVQEFMGSSCMLIFYEYLMCQKWSGMIETSRTKQSVQKI